MFLSFKTGKKTAISEKDNSITFHLSDKISVVISESEAYEEVPEEYLKDHTQGQLDMECGAYNNNYNNYAYVTELFNYLFEGSSRGYLVSGLTKTTLGKEECSAYTAQIISENDDVNGFIYETVQNTHLYIFCFYIQDKLINIYDYTKAIEEFTDSIEFL